MARRDCVIGKFMSYFIEYQHWTFPKHNDKRVVSLRALSIDKPACKMMSQGKSSCILLNVGLMPHYYMIVVFFPGFDIDSSLVSTDSSLVSTDSSLLAFPLLEPPTIQMARIGDIQTSLYQNKCWLGLIPFSCITRPQRVDCACAMEHFSHWNVPQPAN